MHTLTNGAIMTQVEFNQTLHTCLIQPTNVQLRHTLHTELFLDSQAMHYFMQSLVSAIETLGLKQTAEMMNRIGYEILINPSSDCLELKFLKGDPLWN